LASGDKEEKEGERKKKKGGDRTTGVEGVITSLTESNIERERNEKKGGDQPEKYPPSPPPTPPQKTKKRERGEKVRKEGASFCFRHEMGGRGMRKKAE